MKHIITISALTASLLFADQALVDKLNKEVKMFGSPTLPLQIIDAQEKDNIYAIEVSGQRGNSSPGYITKDFSTVIVGRAFDAKTGEPIQVEKDMTEYKKNAPIIYGEGKDEYIVFTDPECPYCHKFEKMLPYLKEHGKFYIYLFPLSFHKNAEQMSQYVLSKKGSDKQIEALIEIANGDTTYSKYKPTDKIKKELEKSMEMANKAGVRGTPTVLDSIGQKVQWPNLQQKYNVQIPLDREKLDYLLEQDLTIKVPGSKGEKLFVFTDTECPYCKRMMEQGVMDKIKDKYEIHVVLYPLPSHPKALPESIYIMSQKDNNKRFKEFKRFMLGADLTDTENAEVKKLFDSKDKDVMKWASLPQIAQQLGVGGTPMFYNEKGFEINPQELR